MKNEYPNLKQLDFRSYLRKNAKSELEKEMLHLFSFEMGLKIYCYGDQFLNSYDSMSKNYKRKIRSLLTDVLCINGANPLFNTKKDPSKITVISNAYHNMGNELEHLGYQVIHPFWIKSLKKNQLVYPKIYKLMNIIWRQIFFGPYKTFLDPKFWDIANQYIKELEVYLIRYEIKGVFVFQDNTFFERAVLKAAKNLKIPTFCCLHGIPQNYDPNDGAMAEYLLCIGPKILEHYHQAKWEGNKGIIIGHPGYKTYSKKALKSSLENVIVLSKSLNGNHISEVYLGDRGNSLTYLEMIKKALQKLGVKKAILRPHPSESCQWYKSFLADNFFVVENHLPLIEVMKTASLFIGPSSNITFEALIMGVNYILFEPQEHKRDILNFILEPPYDGSDQRIMLAVDTPSLISALQGPVTTDLSVIDDYLKTPFNLSEVQKIIQDRL